VRKTFDFSSRRGEDSHGVYCAFFHDWPSRSVHRIQVNSQGVEVHERGAGIFSDLQELTITIGFEGY
jgi:hypothetical protein